MVLYSSMNETPSADTLTFRPLGIPVDERYDGVRLDGHLATHYRFLSRSGWQKRIDEGLVRINGSLTRASYRLRRGDQVSYFYTHAEEPPVDDRIECLWRDGDVMAVYKPGDLPMHENGPYRLNTFANFLAQRFGDEWSAVHRIDKETSGIVLCASTPKAREGLSQQWTSQRVHKTYVAIVHGVPPEDEWLEDGPIGDLAASQIRIKKWVVPDGQSALTAFRVAERGEAHAKIIAHPRTGRTNQIRIHAAVRGFHLVGDKLYHPDEQVFLTYYEQGNIPELARRTGHRRLCLHATELRFQHPVTKQPCRVECPVPEDMNRLWESLRHRPDPRLLTREFRESVQSISL